jgi:hypothetical protein
MHYTPERIYAVIELWKIRFGRLCPAL